MSGPTQRLPFLSASEETCLRPGPSGRIAGVASTGDFFTLFLRDASEFAVMYHNGLGDRQYKEWPWEEDGQKQYDGSLRKVQFMSPVRNSPELSNETRVEEEQRWVARGHAQATLKIRRKLPGLKDGRRFVVVVRWVLAFDGFSCNMAVSCGTLFFKPSSYAKEIREGCVRGYAQSVKIWIAQAEKYAKTHGHVQLMRPSLKEGDDEEGKNEGDGGEGFRDGTRGEKKLKDKDEEESMSGRVPVLEAMRSSVGSSNSIQLSKCHGFLGEYIYLTREIKRVIQGEAAGDLVLEEDLKTGGGGIPVGEEEHGAGLDGLEGRRGKGPGPHQSSGGGGDMEDNTAISSAMSHVSVESARTESWSGSVVGGFGFVDYPAGIPPKQWGRVQDRTVRWLQRGLNVDNLAGGGAPGIGHSNRERSGSVMSGSTFSGGGGSRVPVRQALTSLPSSASFISVGAGGPSSPGTASTREDDLLHLKWLEQLRLVSQQREEDQPAASGHKQVSGDDAADGSVAGRSTRDAFSEGDAGSDAGSDAVFKGNEAEKGGDAGDAETTKRGGSDSRGVAVEELADPAAREGGGGASAKPYTVVFHGRKLGIQLHVLHEIPVVGGLEGYDPDGTRDGRDDGEDEDEDEGAEDLPIEVSPEPSAFDELSLARLGPTGQGGTGGTKGDDLQTIYGGSGGMGGGVATETSSLFDSQSDYDVTVKCIVQCPQLFGEGVKKLWRWRPAAATAGGTAENAAEDPRNPSIFLEAFMKGLNVRLGLGEDCPGVTVSYLDMDVGGGDGEYVSLDIEAWEDFLESRFKRLSVKIDDPVVPEAAPKHDTAAAELRRKEEKGEGGKGGAVSPEGDDKRVGKNEPEEKLEEKEDNDAEGLSASPGLKDERDVVGSAMGEEGGGHDDVSGGSDGGGTVVQSSLKVKSVRDEEEGAARGGEGGGHAPPMSAEESSEKVPGMSSEGKGLASGVQGADGKVFTEGVSEPGDGKGEVGGTSVSEGKEGLAISSRSSTEAHRDDGASCGGEKPIVAVVTIEEAPKVVASQVTSGSAASASPALAAAAEPSRAMTSAQDAVPLSARMIDEIPLGVSAGGVSEDDGSASGAGSRWVDSSDDEGGQGVQGDGDHSGDIGGGKGVRGSATAAGGDVPGAIKGCKKGVDSEETATAEMSAQSTATGAAGSGAGSKVARKPCVGSILMSVNGVRTQGLSFNNVVQLLHIRERPIILEYVDSWDTIFHQHHMETQAREKISRETFEQKLRHPLAAKLRKKIEEWMSAFQTQDLRAMVAETQAEDEDSEKGTKAQGPAVMLWSLIRWLEQELPDVGIFNNNHRAGGGLPVMGELQWKDVKQHLERHIFEQVFDQCLTSAPAYGQGDEDLTAKLASMRFLLPRHWCVDSLKVTGSYGREWELAQGELCRLVEYRCPLDMLDCVKACVRLVALSVEASLTKRQRQIEEAAAAAAYAAAGGKERGGSSSSKSGRNQRVTFGADDLLAALTWVLVQANPPRLASRLWFTSYYMREGVESLGEGAYCLTQLSSALEFASHADASVLADISEDELNEGIEKHRATQNMIKAAIEGNSENVSYWLGAGADPNSLSDDQQCTALTAAITHRRRGVIKILLEGPGRDKVDPKTRICPNFGVQRGRTALMVAAAMGDMSTTLALLRLPGVDRHMQCARGKDAFEYAIRYGHTGVASVLLADPAKATLCQAAKAGNLDYVKALLLQGQDPNDMDSTGQYTPIIAAAFLAHLKVLEALLSNPLCDPNRMNVRGETALMYCSQREGFAIGDSQVAAAVRLLWKGADRHIRDHDGRTPVDWARRFGSMRLLDVLLYDPSKAKIFMVARERDVRGVMALMEQDVDPNTSCPERNYTPLIAAVFNKDEDMASALLSHHKTDVNCPGSHGMTPLMYSAQAGHERMAVLLLRLRADRYRCNDQGETALEIAAVRGHMNLVNVLKYDPERLSICSAAANDDIPAIDGLLAQGVRVDSRHRIRTCRGWHHERYTPLIAASSQGHANMAKRLLVAGATPSLPNLLGQTPLMYAAAFGSEELVLMLLASLKPGARKALDSQGRTALRFAELNGHDEVACILRVDPAVITIQESAAAGRVHEVWALMRQGISGNEARNTSMTRLFESICATDIPDIRVRANQYRSTFEPEEIILTPLSAAAIFSRNRVVEALLSEPTVKVDARDPLGRTALMQAARFGSEGCVLKLLRHGAGRWKRDKARKTASDLAIAAGHLHIAGIISADPKKIAIMEVAAQGRVVLLNGLVKQGASLNFADSSSPYHTPLIASSANGRDEAVRIILQCPGVQVNRRNSKGETALMHAAASHSLKIVRMLMQAGANSQLRDRRNRTAEHWAYKRGHLHMVLVKVLVWLTPRHSS